MAPKRRASSVESETKRRCQSIAKAIKSAEGLSDSCKSMLSGMSTFALGTYQEDRHAWQTSIVGMVQTSILGIEDAMAKKNAQLKKDVAKTSEIKAARAAAVSSAEADLSSKTEVLASKQAAEEEKLGAVKQARAAVKDALKAQSAGDAQLVEVTEKKDALENCKANAFEGLQAGTLTAAADVKQAVNKIASVSKKFDLEKPMVQAALEALKQPPAERSAFLLTSVNQMGEKIGALIAGFADELSKGEPGKQERAAAVAAAEAAKADAISKADAAKAEVAKAQTEKQNAAEALKKAKKALANFYPDMKKLMDACDDGPRQLKEFQDSVMADLKVLETLAPVVEEEPVEEAAEPVAAEEATAAA